MVGEQMIDKWTELKEFVDRQYKLSLTVYGSPAQRLLTGFWKQIKDKMWSIEQNENQQK